MREWQDGENTRRTDQEIFPDQHYGDAKGHTLTMRTYLGSSDSYYLRVFDDKNTPQTPDNPSFGDTGRANIKLERDEQNYVSRAHLQDIETAPPYRGAGNGSRLLAQSENIAQTHGAKEIYGLAPDDERTREWYTQRGYGIRRGPNGGQEVYKLLLPDGTDTPSGYQEPLSGTMLSRQGISALQGREVPSHSAEKLTPKENKSHTSFKTAAAGLAGAAILASSASLLKHADFDRASIDQPSPDKQETIVTRETSAPAVLQQDAILQSPPQSSPPAEYHWSSPPSQEIDSSSAVHPTEVLDVQQATPVPLKSQHDLVYNDQPTQYGCTPASVSMITDYWHQQDLQHPTKTPQEFLDINAAQGEFHHTGMSASALHDDLRQLGYVAQDHVNASFGDLQRDVQQGPVLAVVKLGMEESGLNHAVVVTDVFSDGTVRVNDPWTGKAQVYAKERFLSSWGANFGQNAPTRSYLTVLPVPR
jgi:GNAT superfamily N-acetyltransferase/predicted double-glycine peptidase